MAFGFLKKIGKGIGKVGKFVGKKAVGALKDPRVLAGLALPGVGLLAGGGVGGLLGGAKNLLKRQFTNEGGGIDFGKIAETGLSVAGLIQGSQQQGRSDELLNTAIERDQARDLQTAPLREQFVAGLIGGGPEREDLSAQFADPGNPFFVPPEVAQAQAPIPQAEPLPPGLPPEPLPVRPGIPEDPRSVGSMVGLPKPRIRRRPVDEFSGLER